MIQGSIRRVEIRILTDFTLHLFSFFLMMQQDHSITEVFLLNLELRPAEQSGVPIDSTVNLRSLHFHAFGFLEPQSSLENIVIE